MFLTSSCQLPLLKQEFAGELSPPEALKQEREQVQDEMKRLREELQEKNEAELCALKSDLDRDMEKERIHLEKELHEEKEKLKSLQAALDNDESKIRLHELSVELLLPVRWEVFGVESIQVVVLQQLVTCWVCLLGPQVLLVKQRLEAQYGSELQRAKSCMATEIKELTAVLQEQGEEQLCQAQER